VLPSGGEERGEVVEFVALTGAISTGEELEVASVLVHPETAVVAPLLLLPPESALLP